MLGLLLGFSAVVGPQVGPQAGPPSGPLSPEVALATFETEPGLRVELVAAEPLVASPCALAFDEGGRMLVAENRGYPSGPGEGKPPAGVVAYLEDTDSDGRMDRRIDFAVGLTFPNGVMPWRGGAIVTCAPDVFWLKDEDGDRKADRKEILLTGFATNQSTQLRVNDPTLGPDGWVYLAGGLSGGQVVSPRRPGTSPLSLDRGDLRFKPDSGEVEATDGKSQFGLAFDDAGNRFACFNRVQVQHAVLPSRYLARSPHAASPGALQDCPELLENPLLRGGGGAARIYPISSNVTTADSHVGTYTAACAVHFARGAALPPELRGCVWSCDPTGNLVRYDRLEPSGATFVARRAREGTEALRSRDDWFRPVFLADGPDGGLYIADMYRQTIEHPEYLPEEVRRRTDFDGGKDKGRIWRLAAASAKPGAPSGIGSMSTAHLVAALSSPESWRRETAFRLLVERGDRSAAPLIAEGLAEASEAGPAVLQLRLLEVLGALDDGALASALAHPLAAVRRNALALAERGLASAPRLAELALTLAEDPDAHVRFQAALSLGEIGGERVVQALAAIAARDAGDRWARAAVLSSVPGREAGLALLRRLLEGPMESIRGDGNDEGRIALVLELARTVASGVQGGEALGLLERLERVTRLAKGSGRTVFDLRAALLLGAADGLGAGPLAETSGEAGRLLSAVVADARGILGDASAPLGRRVRAARALGLAPGAENAGALLGVVGGLDPTEPTELKVAAARALAVPVHADAACDLLAAERWESFSPAVRAAIVATMVARRELAAPLLDAVESGAVPTSALNASQREQLKGSKDRTLAERAGKLFQGLEAGDRRSAYEEAKKALALPGQAAKGRETFRRLCAQCHRLDREGSAVGPDLFDVRNQPKESILFHVVVPEHEVLPAFVAYTVETRDGRVLTGLLAAETPGAVTLRQAQGIEETVPRAAIASVSASTLSFMPQGLEQGLSGQDIADLLAYLKGEG
ncbi:MAG: HEAT repeat domain-containing protein [Planctomycetes bacterium]|nr:HEAT repeat domain-containing protein [Planctomycetota bacterium]